MIVFFFSFYQRENGGWLWITASSKYQAVSGEKTANIVLPPFWKGIFLESRFHRDSSFTINVVWRATHPTPLAPP